MKRQLFRILSATIALSMVTWLMSCGGTTQNTNQSSQNTNQASVANDETFKGLTSGSCSQKEVSDYMAAVLTGDGGKIDHVAAQYSSKYINFHVGLEGGKNVIVIEGGFSDGHPGEPDKNREIMEKVTAAIDQLIEKECVFRAVYVPKGTIANLKPGQDLRDVKGFEWSSCEWPDVACPGGLCKPSCDLPGDTKPVATPNANSNANSNSNSNANSNANRTN